MLHVTDLTSATLLTHTTGDDAGSSTCELGAAAHADPSSSMASLRCVRELFRLPNS